MMACRLAGLCTLCVSLALGQIDDTANHSSRIINGSFLVDNSKLHHNGPGVLLRRSKHVEDIVGSDQYLKWGTRFLGRAAGEGWVQYKDYYLPASIKGVQILTLENIFLEKTGKPQLRPARFHYALTEMQVPSGDWVPCRILKAGTKPNTYNVQVHPPHFSSYNITDAPATSLKRVKKIREFSPVPPATPPPAQPPSYVHLVVNDTKGNSVRLKMFKKSPLRTAMKMACGKAGIPEFKCLHKVQFTWHGKAMKPDDFTFDLNMTDGATLIMMSK